MEYGARRMRLRNLSFLAATFVAVSTYVACYPAAGEGVDPPAFGFYFPVGLTVSKGGNVLYAVNSDFDLQWNGGTIQSLDLHLIRRHTAMAIQDPTNPNLPLARPPDPNASCPGGPPVISTLNDAGVATGWACAPPTIASFYMRDSVAIGAFASDIQLSMSMPSQGGPNFSRVLVPVRGDASLTWADIIDDDPAVAPDPAATADTYAPFRLDCGTRDAHRRCDKTHHAGNDPGQPGDSRLITMPGEPFGMAQSDDGASIVITHQSAANTSLFATFTPDAPYLAEPPKLMPSIQFVLGGVPTGGIGVAAIPHDPDAFAECIPDRNSDACKAVLPRPAFLETSRAAPQVALLRYYSDIGIQNSNPFRPFLQNEADYTLNINAGATDFARGIAMDPSPRIRCKAALDTTAPDYPVQLEACAQLPARVFVASRGPSSLLVGQVGEPITQSGSYAPDLAFFTKSVPLAPTAGPSSVHIAPIINRAGNYALRVFVVCFDASQIVVYDPDNESIDAIIPVGLGPFSLAFDPFDFNGAARGDAVAIDPRDADLGLKKFRFAYVGSFSQSYLQVIDLDNSTADKSTVFTVVYTVGVPTSPKGS